jgi:hypothetical protein
MYAYIYICIYIYLHVCIYVCMYAYICMHVCMYVCMHTYVYNIYIYVYIYQNGTMKPLHLIKVFLSHYSTTYIYIQIFIYMCLHIHIYILHIYIYIYIYIYVYIYIYTLQPKKTILMIKSSLSLRHISNGISKISAGKGERRAKPIRLRPFKYSLQPLHCNTTLYIYIYIYIYIPLYWSIKGTSDHSILINNY